MSDVVPSCNLYEFLRLFEVVGRGKILQWRARPAILIMRPVLQLRLGGIRMTTDARYALLLFQPNATRSAINAMNGTAPASALVELVSANDECKRHAFVRNLLAEHNSASATPRHSLERLGQREEQGEQNNEVSRT